MCQYTNAEVLMLSIISRKLLPAPFRGSKPVDWSVSQSNSTGQATRHMVRFYSLLSTWKRFLDSNTKNITNTGWCVSSFIAEYFLTFFLSVLLKRAYSSGSGLELERPHRGVVRSGSGVSAPNVSDQDQRFRLAHWKVPFATSKYSYTRRCQAKESWPCPRAAVAGSGLRIRGHRPSSSELYFRSGQQIPMG
jgi:hypothetical protein